jgi:hypothetical protein
MTFKDKPTFENVFFGHFNSRRLELTYIFERELVFKCHISYVSFNRLNEELSTRVTTCTTPPSALENDFDLAATLHVNALPAHVHVVGFGGRGAAAGGGGVGGVERLGRGLHGLPPGAYTRALFSST